MNWTHQLKSKSPINVNTPKIILFSLLSLSLNPSSFSSTSSSSLLYNVSSKNLTLPLNLKNITSVGLQFHSGVLNQRLYFCSGLTNLLHLSFGSVIYLFNHHFLLGTTMQQHTLQLGDLWYFCCIVHTKPCFE